MECTFGQMNGQYALKVERFIASPPDAQPAEQVTGENNG